MKLTLITICIQTFPSTTIKEVKIVLASFHTKEERLNFKEISLPKRN